MPCGTAGHCRNKEGHSLRWSSLCRPFKPSRLPLWIAVLLLALERLHSLDKSRHLQIICCTSSNHFTLVSAPPVRPLHKGPGHLRRQMGSSAHACAQACARHARLCIITNWQDVVHVLCYSTVQSSSKVPDHTNPVLACCVAHHCGHSIAPIT